MAVVTTYEFVPDIAEFIANGFQDADQFGSTVAALAGGGFAIAYGNDFGSFLTPHVSFFGADGAPVAGPLGSFFLPYTGTAAGVQMIGAPDILQLMNGNVLVTWNAVSSFSGTELLSAVLDPVTGAVLTPEFLVQNVNATTDFETAQLVGGNRIYVLDGEFGTNIFVRNSAGTHIASYMFGDVFETYHTIAVAALNNGQFVVCSLLDGAPALMYEIRNSNGVRSEATVRIDLPGNTDIGAPALAALPQGGFAVAFASTSGGSAGLSLLIVTNSVTNPTPIGPIRIDTNLAAVESEASVTVLADGFLLVSWTQSDGAGDTDIMGRLFDFNGVPVVVDGTDAPFVIAGGSSDASDSALAAWGQGRFITTWTDSEPDADGNSIRAEVVSLVRQTVGDSSANLMSGDGLADSMIADGGHDTLNGFGGDDTLRGGDGNDTLQGGIGADVLDGGANVDMVVYWDATAGVVVDMLIPASNTGIAAGDTFVGVENLAGSDFTDDLRGDNAGNVIYGFDGNDVVNGRNGNDTLGGNLGNDTLIGGEGADVLQGGAGVNMAAYWSSASGLTIDMLNLAANTGHALGDTYSLITQLAGTNFNDILRADNAANLLNGLDGHDEINGRNGNDTLNGGAGNDTLIGGQGADVLQGGAGLNVASYASALVGLTLDMLNTAINTGDAVGDSYSLIQDIVGSTFNDIIRGDNGSGLLAGLAGNDEINGRNGNDTLNGGAGNDTLIGGQGADRLVGDLGTNMAAYWTSMAGMTVDLLNYSYNTGDAAGDFMLHIRDIAGSNLTDTIRGDLAGNGLFGFDGNDTLIGRDGDDTLHGGQGNDSLFGMIGNDVMTGGGGFDSFVFNTALGAAHVDHIADFNAAQDSIVLEDGVFTALAATGVLTAPAFGIGSAATTAEQRIIYNQGSGQIFYDTDGVGGAEQVLFATVIAGTAITNADFLVV